MSSYLLSGFCLFCCRFTSLIENKSAFAVVNFSFVRLCYHRIYRPRTLAESYTDDDHPILKWTREYWMSLVAILGTTISPYLFFWQASQEAEDARLSHDEQPLRKKPSQAFAQFRRIATDTRVGMAFSNLVAFYIILTTAVTLQAAGLNQVIQTAADAAKALQP
jgi:Mn2+/Fe2+ NRAMP family transporter